MIKDLSEYELRLVAEVQKILSLPQPIDWEAVKKIGEEIQRIAEEAQNVI